MPDPGFETIRPTQDGPYLVQHAATTYYGLAELLSIRPRDTDFHRLGPRIVPGLPIKDGILVLPNVTIPTFEVSPQGDSEPPRDYYQDVNKLSVGAGASVDSPPRAFGRLAQMLTGQHQQRKPDGIFNINEPVAVILKFGVTMEHYLKRYPTPNGAWVTVLGGREDDRIDFRIGLVDGSESYVARYDPDARSLIVEPLPETDNPAFWTTQLRSAANTRDSLLSLEEASKVNPIPPRPAASPAPASVEPLPPVDSPVEKVVSSELTREERLALELVREINVDSHSTIPGALKEIIENYVANFPSRNITGGGLPEKIIGVVTLWSRNLSHQSPVTQFPQLDRLSDERLREEYCIATAQAACASLFSSDQSFGVNRATMLRFLHLKYNNQEIGFIVGRFINNSGVLDGYSDRVVGDNLVPASHFANMAENEIAFFYKSLPREQQEEWGFLNK